MEVNDLSLEEKVAQMFMFGINDSNTDGILNLIKNNKIGGVILYKKNYNTYEEMLNLVKKLKDANSSNKIPLFIAIDEEGGRVNRLPKEFINIKSIYQTSQLNDKNLIKEHAKIISDILVSSGINMNFSPVLDIYNDSGSNVLVSRCFSNNKDVVADFGVEYMKTMQNNNLIPVVKHFPGHGCTKKDSHIFLPLVVDYKEILIKHIKPFEYAIKNDCDAIMVSHIVIRKLTKLLPTSLSKTFIKKYLREEYNYDNLVITDDIRMHPVNLLYKFISLRKAFSGENDIVLFKYRENDAQTINKVIEMVRKNKISEEKINDSVSRILRIKEKYNINNNIDIVGCNIIETNKAIQELNDKLN